MLPCLSTFFKVIVFRQRTGSPDTGPDNIRRKGFGNPEPPCGIIMGKTDILQDEPAYEFTFPVCIRCEDEIRRIKLPETAADLLEDIKTFRYRLVLLCRSNGKLGKFPP